MKTKKNLNLLSASKKSVLYYACVGDHSELICWLLYSKASPDFSDYMLRAPIYLSFRRKKIEANQFFRTYGEGNLKWKKDTHFMFTYFFNFLFFIFYFYFLILIIFFFIFYIYFYFLFLFFIFFFFLFF